MLTKGKFKVFIGNQPHEKYLFSNELLAISVLGHINI